jgi:methyl-accepting chemotaxis protein
VIFKRSIKWKLAASFAAVVALLAIVVGVAVWSVTALHSVSTTMNDSIVPRMTAVDDVRSSAADMHFSQTRYALDGTLTARKDYEFDHTTFEHDLSVLKSRVKSASDQQLYAGILAKLAVYEKLDKQLWADVQAKKMNAAKAMVNGAGNDANDALVAAMTDFQTVLRKEAQSQSNNASSTASTSELLVLLLGLVSIAVAAALALLLARQISSAANQLLTAARGLAVGDVEQHVDLHSEDELGQTASAFRDMIAYLQRMAEAARRIAGRDLTVEVEPASEADVLGTAFAEMASGLRAIVTDLAEQANALNVASEQIATTSVETGRAVGEIATAIGAVAHGADRQVRMVEQASVTSSVSSEAAEQARGLAGEGAAAAQQASAAMASVNEASGQVNEAIRALADKSGQIGGIVATITGLADQTNLLALNAAIEAARAGEQGRGFAVVAEEVRKLAEQSQDAAAQIASLIAEIQSETERVVAVVEDGAERTGEGTAVVERVREAFQSIDQAVQSVSGQITEIASATAEVASVAQDTSASTEEVSASTQQTSASVDQLAASAQELSVTAGRLQELVAAFQV